MRLWNLALSRDHLELKKMVVLNQQERLKMCRDSASDEDPFRKQNVIHEDIENIVHTRCKRPDCNCSL